MASIQAKCDIVRAAAASIGTCTPATTVTLKELLISDDSSPAATSTIRAPKKTSSSRTKATTSAKATTSKTGARQAEQEELSPKEKAALATHIINAALKALGNASKPAVPTPCKKQSSEAEL